MSLHKEVPANRRSLELVAPVPRRERIQNVLILGGCRLAPAASTFLLALYVPQRFGSEVYGRFTIVVGLASTAAALAGGWLRNGIIRYGIRDFWGVYTAARSFLVPLVLGAVGGSIAVFLGVESSVRSLERPILGGSRGLLAAGILVFFIARSRVPCPGTRKDVLGHGAGEGITANPRVHECGPTSTSSFMAVLTGTAAIVIGLPLTTWLVGRIDSPNLLGGICPRLGYRSPTAVVEYGWPL